MCLGTCSNKNQLYHALKKLNLSISHQFKETKLIKKKNNRGAN